MAYDWEKLKKRAEQIDNLFGGSKTVTTSEVKRLGKSPVSTSSDNFVSKSIEQKKSETKSFPTGDSGGILKMLTTPTETEYGALSLDELREEQKRLKQRISALRSANQGGLMTFTRANDQNAARLRTATEQLDEVNKQIRTVQENQKNNAAALASLAEEQKYAGMSSTDMLAQLEELKELRDAAQERANQTSRGITALPSTTAKSTRESLADARERAETDYNKYAKAYNDLLNRYYKTENEEKKAAIQQDRDMSSIYQSAQDIQADMDKVAVLMGWVGQKTGDPQEAEAAKIYLMDKYGIDQQAIDQYAISGAGGAYTPRTDGGYNNLYELYQELEAKKEQAVSDLSEGGYDYERMAGYAQMQEDAERSKKNMAQWQETANKYPVLSSIDTLLFAPVQGIDFLKAMGSNIGHSDTDDPESYVPMNSYNMDAVNYVNTVRQTVASDIEENTDWDLFGQNVASFLYQTGMSIGDSSLNLLAFGPTGALVVGSSNAAANQAKDIIDRGGTKEQAFLGGMAAGTFEAIFEKVSIDHLLATKSVTGWKSWLKETAQQAGVEASEETFTEIANILADASIMGDNSNFNRSVDAYIAQGMSQKDAQSQAFMDLIGQVVQAGVGGAVSGGAMGGTVNARNWMSHINTITRTNQDIVNRANQRLSSPGQVMSDFMNAGLSLPTVQQQAPVQVNTPVNAQEETIRPAVLQTAAEQVEAPSVSAASRYQINSIPVQERTWKDAGNRKINAFQFDHPELHPYYVEAARALKYDLASSVKGERIPQFDADGYITGYTGTTRSVTEPIEQALDNAKLSYSQIDKALNDLIADNGQENYAAAKKVELVLDDMLTNGYTDSDGYDVPPNEAYISARDQASSGLTGSEYRMSEEEWNSIMAQESESPAFLPTIEQEYGPESSVGAARKGFDHWSAFQGTKSEFFPEGANAARPIDVPTTDPEGRRVRKTASTAMGAKAIPDEVVGEIQNMVMSGQLSYDRVTDSASTARAVSRIQNDGFQRALSDFSAAVEKGVVSKDLATLGQQLLVTAANAGDANATAELLSLYAQMETTAGQAVQAASILRKLSPTSQLYAAQKAVDNLNKTINKGKKTSSGNTSSGSRKPSASENVPVEIWMQRVGENLADELARRVKAPKEQIQTVSQTILSDLRHFSSETAPKRLPTAKKRTEFDRIIDLFQNRTAYEEAWQAAKDTLSDTFEDNPDALAAFDSWLDSSLDYSEMLTKELTGQTEIKIPDELVEKFLQQTDQAGRDTVLREIYQKVADQVPSTWKDKWNAWRYLAMLGNPRTHFKNILGNVFFQPVRFIKDRLAAVIESGVSAASGGRLQRTKSFAYNPALYKVAWQDFDNVSDVLSGNKYDDIQSIINNKRTIFKTKLLEMARRGNSNLLSAEDMAFKRVTYADALAGYLNANGVTAEQMKAGTVDPALLSAARDYAGREALKATFNDRNAVSDRVVQAARSLGTFGEAVLPFKRTPANILVRGFEYSPLGLAKGLTYDLYQVKQGNMTGAEAIDHIASGLTGSALMALGGLMAAAGVVTGGAGDDEKQAEFNELTGGQTYALNLPGGGSVTLDWLAPEALPFFMGVQLMQTSGEEGLTGDSITSAFASISEPMLEMSMLQSLNDLIDNVSFAASNEKLQGLVGSSLISYLTQAIPTLGGQIERSSEDSRMSTYTEKNSMVPSDVQYALGKASARIPGWDYQQIPYIDAWGRTESNGPLPLRMFNNFLNPAYTSQENVTPLDEEIQRLYDDTGDNAVIPDRAPRYLTIGGERVDLNAEQYVQYATERGQTAFELGSDLIENDIFSGLTNQQKVDALDKVYTYADAMAKADVSNYEPEDWMKEVDASGVDPVTAILYRMSEADADTKRQMLMDDDSLTPSEKAALEEIITGREAARDYSSEEAFALSGLSDSGQEKWARAEAWGMPYEDYVKFYPICAASGKGMTKAVVIQNLIDAGMSQQDALNFWNLIRN